jgi:hypothetical protein
MSPIRLYLDEDAMRRSLVFGLTARTVDVITAFDAKMINRDDEAHLVIASNLGRTVYTYNAADFCLLHQRWIREGAVMAESSLARNNAIDPVKSFAGSCVLSAV